MRTNRALLVLGLAAAAWAVPADAVFAGKPSGGGGGLDGGVVYYMTGTTSGGSAPVRTWSMNPDGSGKTQLPNSMYEGFDWPQPSRELHGGHRWFIAVLKIAGETYPYPSTTVHRRELFAVRDDGAIVRQLTFQADLQCLGARWSPGDAAISWGAGRWVGTVRQPTQVYMAAVVFDGNGDVVGLASQPSAPAVPIADVASHDWSPDGSRLVVGTWPTGGDPTLSIVELGTGASTSLATGVAAIEPTWSPDGSRIAFEGRDGTIRTIAPSGGDENVLVALKRGESQIYYRSPEWSPHGTHLVYVRSTITGGPADIFRIAANGGSGTNLTSMASGTYANGAVWR